MLDDLSTIAARICPECLKRGKPTNFSSDPACAFLSGEFSGDNWNCATANALRELSRPEDGNWEDAFNRRVDDQSVGVFPYKGRWLSLTWYKERGQVEMIRWVDNGIPISLAEAQSIIAARYPDGAKYGSR